MYMPFTLNLTIPLRRASRTSNGQYANDSVPARPILICDVFFCIFAVEAGGGVHGVQAGAARHAPADHRVLRAPLPREILRRRRNIGRAVGEVARGNVESNDSMSHYGS